MPRYAGTGPLAINKRIAEILFLKTYDLELEQAPQPRIWAYRKAAWTVDEWPESAAEIYSSKGESGVTALPGIGSSIVADIIRTLKTLDCDPIRPDGF
jgi:DNA polymerase/3'-5' exonuclease PolX